MNPDDFQAVMRKYTATDFTTENARTVYGSTISMIGRDITRISWHGRVNKRNTKREIRKQLTDLLRITAILADNDGLSLARLMHDEIERLEASRED